MNYLDDAWRYVPKVLPGDRMVVPHASLLAIEGVLAYLHAEPVRELSATVDITSDDPPQLQCPNGHRIDTVRVVLDLKVEQSYIEPQCPRCPRYRGRVHAGRLGTLLYEAAAEGRAVYRLQG